MLKYFIFARTCLQLTKLPYTICFVRLLIYAAYLFHHCKLPKQCVIIVIFFFFCSIALFLFLQTRSRPNQFRHRKNFFFFFSCFAQPFILVCMSERCKPQKYTRQIVPCVNKKKRAATLQIALARSLPPLLRAYFTYWVQIAASLIRLGSIWFCVFYKLE